MPASRAFFMSRTVSHSFSPKESGLFIVLVVGHGCCEHLGLQGTHAHCAELSAVTCPA